MTPTRTKREEILERLLRQTWEALPFVLAEDAGTEVDWGALSRIADPVRAALGEPPVDWEIVRLPVPRDSTGDPATGGQGGAR